MTFDHEFKIARAYKHLQDLDEKVTGWLGGDHHTVRYETNLDARWTGPIPPGPALPYGGYYLAGSVFIPGMGPRTAPDGIEFGEGTITAYATAEDPPIDPFSLIIGEVLHNLRSALDNLAYALAAAFTDPLPQEVQNSSEFPIFGDEDRSGPGVGFSHFHKTKRDGTPAPGSGLAKIQGWDPKAQTVVEGLQPYHRGNAFREDELWVLHELDRINKHRLLHPTVAALAGTTWDIANFRNVRCIGPGHIEAMGGRVETDTPISRIWGVHPIDPDVEMHMEIGPALAVALSEDAPVAAGEPVVGVLGSIYNHLVTKVIPSLSEFL